MTLVAAAEPKVTLCLISDKAFNEYMGTSDARVAFIFGSAAYHSTTGKRERALAQPVAVPCGPGHKTLVAVHSFGDFWSWLRLGLVPLVLPRGWVYSERRVPDAPWRQ